MQLRVQELRKNKQRNDKIDKSNKLIQRIEVHNPEKKHARKSVKVDIYFTAVGVIRLPDEQEISKMAEQICSPPQTVKKPTA